MTSPTRTLRRAGVAVAVAVAAALSVTAASAAPQRPAAARALRACKPSKLTVWMGVPGSGTAGAIYYPIEISNISHVACTLKGYPKVVATSGGTPVGLPARHDKRFKAKTVRLAPGATAHAVIKIDNAGNYGCALVNADGLAVTPPGAARALATSFGTFQVCSATVTMHVRVVRPKTGIPGVSQ